MNVYTVLRTMYMSCLYIHASMVANKLIKIAKTNFQNNNNSACKYTVALNLFAWEIIYDLKAFFFSFTKNIAHSNWELCFLYVTLPHTVWATNFLREKKKAMIHSEFRVIEKNARHLYTKIHIDIDKSDSNASKTVNTVHPLNFSNQNANIHTQIYTKHNARKIERE